MRPFCFTFVGRPQETSMQGRISSEGDDFFDENTADWVTSQFENLIRTGAQGVNLIYDPELWLGVNSAPHVPSSETFRGTAVAPFAIIQLYNLKCGRARSASRWKSDSTCLCQTPALFATTSKDIANNFAFLLFFYDELRVGKCANKQKCLYCISFVLYLSNAWFVFVIAILNTRLQIAKYVRTEQRFVRN